MDEITINARGTTYKIQATTSNSKKALKKYMDGAWTAPDAGQILDWARARADVLVFEQSQENDNTVYRALYHSLEDGILFDAKRARAIFKSRESALAFARSVPSYFKVGSVEGE